MSDPLAPIWQGFIQQEEARAKAPVSEYLQQKIGSDVMYLKKQYDDLVAAIAQYTSTGGLATQTIISGSTSATINSPSGKPYYCGIMYLEQSANRVSKMAILCPGITAALSRPDINTVYQTFLMSGSTVVQNGAWIHEVSGVLLYVP